MSKDQIEIKIGGKQPTNSSHSRIIVWLTF